jgi:hypothetical protein
MSEHMLHIMGPGMAQDLATIAGDRAALVSLRDALNEALASGSGGIRAYCSDGEPFDVAIIAVQDMYPVCTAYSHAECGSVRSARETVAIHQLVNFHAAVGKASVAVNDRSANISSGI